MSSYVAVSTSTCAWLLSDTAGLLRSDGRLVHHAQKHIRMGSHAALAWMGRLYIFERFLELVGPGTSWEALVGGPRPIAPAAWATVQDEMPVTGHLDSYCAVLAGWNASLGRPEMFSLDARQRPSGADLLVCAHVGHDTPDGAALIQRHCDRIAEDTDAFVPERDGLALMRAMRGLSVQFPNGARCHTVGGAVLCTRIDKDGVHQRLIHQWPDRLGEPIRLEEAA